MVKGITRRVIVIKSPDRRIFEEAIFIIREDVFKNGGVSAEDVVGEASRVASAYIRRHGGPRRVHRYMWPAILVGSGVALTAIGWILSAVL